MSSGSDIAEGRQPEITSSVRGRIRLSTAKDLQQSLQKTFSSHYKGEKVKILDV